MVKSNTKIEKQIQKKTNPELVETIRLAKKNKDWIKVAAILSGSRRNKIEVNLDKISSEAKQGEVLVIPGKVLSLGSIDKKIKVVAFNFSEKAKEKLLKAGCEIMNIVEEIKKNPGAKGVKIIK
jgi:large subunit ribosomal protein L18e